MLQLMVTLEPVIITAEGVRDAVTHTEGVGCSAK